jgi:hypothetical protein
VTSDEGHPILGNKQGWVRSPTLTTKKKILRRHGSEESSAAPGHWHTRYKFSNGRPKDEISESLWVAHLLRERRAFPSRTSRRRLVMAPAGNGSISLDHGNLFVNSQQIGRRFPANWSSNHSNLVAKSQQYTQFPAIFTSKPSNLRVQQQ